MRSATDAPCYDNETFDCEKSAHTPVVAPCGLQARTTLNRSSDGRNLDSQSGIVNDNDDTGGRLRTTVTENHQDDI
jgi:hypothetical protein